MKRTHMTLIGLALALSVAGAAFGQRDRGPKPAAPEGPIAALDAFAVAEVLAKAPPDVVVVTLDEAKHPLRGAVPQAVFGADDEAFVKAAPAARRVILAGADPARMDRVARRLAATGHRVSVLAGGVGAWDAAMDADPGAPPATASSMAWQRYRTNVALRRSFGDAEAAPAAPIAAPIAPVGPAGGGAKKREGC